MHGVPAGEVAAMDRPPERGVLVTHVVRFVTFTVALPIMSLGLSAVLFGVLPVGWSLIVLVCGLLLRFPCVDEFVVDPLVWLIP